MELPEELRAQIDRLAEEIGAGKLAREAQALSERYRTGKRDGRRLLTAESEAVAYAVSRMPATCGAVSAALAQATAALPTPFRPRTLLDVGAGTGAASWAAWEYCVPERIVCLEREGAMRAVGQRLAEAGPPPLREASWRSFDLTGGPLPLRAELVTAAYLLNELEEGARDRAADALWEAAEGMLLLVEPGTPAGFGILRRARDRLLGQGARIAAPCPSGGPCPMEEGDWCHFTCRVARSRMHRLLKGGDAPYEDEKFAYLAFCRETLLPDSTWNKNGQAARILRHPQVGKGRIELTLCTSGSIQMRMVTKKEAAAFRQARKARCGDRFDLMKREG